MSKVLQGLGVSLGRVQARVKIVTKPEDRKSFQEGDILITRITDPTMVTLMAKASAIITDIGGMTSHPAIVSRELGIPCVVATQNGTSTLRDGQMVTVDGQTGEVVLADDQELLATKESHQPMSAAKSFAIDRSGFDHDLEDYLGSLRQAFLKMDLGTIQPFNFNEIEPLLAEKWITTYLLPLMSAVEKSGLEQREVARLLHTPSTIRSIMIFDLFMSKIASISHKQRLDIARFYINLLKSWCSEDPFAHRKNMIHTRQEVEQLSDDLQSADPEKARMLGRIISACYHAAYGLYSELNPELVYESYGPYDVSARFGAGHTMVVKEFSNLKPVEIWPELATFPYTKVRIVSVYKDVEFRMDAITHAEYRGDTAQGLKYFSLEVDGAKYPWEKTTELISALNQHAEDAWERWTKLPLEQAKEKYALQKAYSYKLLCEKLGLEWQPGAEVMNDVRGKPLARGMWPRFTRKESEIDFFMNIIDPRT